MALRCGHSLNSKHKTKVDHIYALSKLHLVLSAHASEKAAITHHLCPGYPDFPRCVLVGTNAVAMACLFEFASYFAHTNPHGANEAAG